MKKFVSLLCVLTMLLSCMALPPVYAQAAPTEEKIDLSDKKLYRFAYDKTNAVFKCTGEVTNDNYKIYTNGDYTMDGAIGQQIFVMIDLGKEYPISTIKAYQQGTSNSNFVAIFENCNGTDYTFVKEDWSNLLRTDIEATVENGVNCYTKTALNSTQHNMGSYRYIFIYNWSTKLTLSEIEIYRDTTEKTDSLSVNNFYGDNMVLQRNKNHVIKGYSATGESVNVTMAQNDDPSNTQTVTAIPDDEGRWKAELLPMKAGMSPYTITVTDGTTAEDVVLENVLVGDVFLASGQSNMAYDAPKSATQRTTANNNVDGPNGMTYYKKGMFELQSAIASEQIRMFKMRDDTEAESGVVTDDVPIWIDWCGSDGERNETNSSGTATSLVHTNILAMSSLAAFFADSVKEEGIPVGIIQATRGGSPISIWSEKGTLYNSHIAPLEGLNIAGVLWYQGCANSNATGFKTYYDDFKKLIKNYRKVFNDSTLPFLYVQLAPYDKVEPEYSSPGSQRFEVMREIQREMLNDSEVNTNLYMAVSMDTTQDSHHDANHNIINQALIHPLGKDILGKRMANAYLGMTKNDGRVISGPMVKEATANGNTITVSFEDNTAEGLKVLNPDYSYQCNGTGRLASQNLEEFKVAGADGIYYDASAVIEGETVKVVSEEVSEPKYVSYAYSGLPANPNLANGANLPASPFNIGIDGATAPTTAPESEPTATPEPEVTAEPTPEPTPPVFTTAPTASMKRGVEEAITDVDIPVNKAMQFEDGDNVAVIGDSITNSDFYVAYLSEIYAAKKPDAKVRFYNMGIGGNTALLGRQMLDQEFAMVKKYDNVVPNKAIVMFGMNDTNMSSDETTKSNLEEYLANMSDLIDAIKAKGVEEIIIVSSTPYDDTLENDAPISSGFVGARARMMTYAEELVSLTKEKNCHFINMTKIMYELLDEYQKNDKTITFINASDRIHPKEFGNYIMAYIIAKSQGLAGYNSCAQLSVNGETVTADSAAIADIQKNDNSISFSYTPSGKYIGVTAPYAQADQVIPLTKEFNQEIIKISNMPQGNYEIDMDGSKSGPYTAEELEQGINLALIENSPITRRSAQLYGDMFAGHEIVVKRIRNIRTAEKKAMLSGIDLNDDEAVKAYVENAGDELKAQFKNAYINYKAVENELFAQCGEYSDKLYEDVKNLEPVKITIRPNTVANETAVWYENFTDGTDKWKILQINGNATSAAEYGSAVYKTVTGSQTVDGSGAGAVEIEIGLNKCRNYLTLANYINVLEGVEYTVSSNVKTDNVRQTDLVNMSAIFLANDQKTVVAQVDIEDTQKGTHDWTTISQNIKAPEGAAYLRLDIAGRCFSEDATEKQGTVWFDDVKVSTALKNADFENSTDNVVSDWATDSLKNPIPENYSEDLMTFKTVTKWKVGSSGSTVKASYDTGNYVTGGRSVKFVSAAEGETADRYYIYPDTTEYIKLKPETNYKITMKAKVENYKLLSEFSQKKPAGISYQALLYGESNGALDSSQVYTISNSYMGVDGSTETAITKDWADYSMILTTPAAKTGQTCQYLRSNVMMRYASGTAWVDSILIQECDENGEVYTNENADTENKISGSQSILVNGTYTSVPVSVIGTADYMLSVYAKADTDIADAVAVEMYNSQGEKVYESAVDVLATADFKEVTSVITAPADAVYAKLVLSSQNGAMNVDALKLSLINAKKNLAFEAGEPKEVSPQYADILTVKEIADNGKVTLVVSPQSNQQLPELVLYSATYNMDGTLKSLILKECVAKESGVIETELPEVNISGNETSKTMLWDENQIAVISNM